jgi:hypothetical protein
MLLELLLKWKKQIIFVGFAVALLVASFSAGYWYHKPQTITQTVTQTVEKIVEKKIYVTDKTKIDVVDTKPNGEVIHTITQNDVSTAEQVDEKVEAKTDTKTVIADTKPNYSLGVHAAFPLEFPIQRPETWDLEVGRRIFGNLWGEGLFLRDGGQNKVGGGLKWEF